MIKITANYFLVFFLIFIVSCSSDGNEKEINEEKDFCGLKFTNTHGLRGNENIPVESITIFNFYGTYISYEDSTFSPYTSEMRTLDSLEGEPPYRYCNFSGTWEIVKDNIAPQFDEFFRVKDIEKKDYTLIKYKSNKGKERYAFIQKDPKLSSYQLRLIVLEDEAIIGGLYKPEEFDLFEGFGNVTLK